MVKVNIINHLREESIKITDKRSANNGNLTIIDKKIADNGNLMIIDKRNADNNGNLLETNGISKIEDFNFIVANRLNR